MEKDKSDNAPSLAETATLCRAVGARDLRGPSIVYFVGYSGAVAGYAALGYTGRGAMSSTDNSVMNSPCREPDRRWLLDEHGAPTQIVNQGRRRSEYLVPVVQPKKATQQTCLDLEARNAGGATFTSKLINKIRGLMTRWRALPPSQAGTTQERLHG